MLTSRHKLIDKHLLLFAQEHSSNYLLGSVEILAALNRNSKESEIARLLWNYYNKSISKILSY